MPESQETRTAKFIEKVHAKVHRLKELKTVTLTPLEVRAVDLVLTLLRETEGKK